MEFRHALDRARAVRSRFAGTGVLIGHWVGTAVLAGTAYMTYTEADVLGLVAMVIGLFAVLLSLRSIGETADRLGYLASE